MRALNYLATTGVAWVVMVPAAAETLASPPVPAQVASPAAGEAFAAAARHDEEGSENVGDIIVTAQRQSQRLQDVPIAISAFSAESIERQQIVNPVALQQTLPSITFTKNNFTSSTFTIRGVGDLCVGGTCDQATAIHVNDMPLISTRLFEAEFFDLERIEVLRGPQGTLFGRNATAGVINFITARPDMTAFRAAGEFEYGNFDSKRARAMVNVPIIGDTLALRVAGTYLNRDGYTRNLRDGSRIDDRDLYAVRGTLSWRPSASTRLDLMAYYFREDDNRSRYQKQLCTRDTTGVLGCLPTRLDNQTSNGNASLATLLSSREFLQVSVGNSPLRALAPVFANLGLQSVYGADGLAGAVNPADVRTVDIDFRPTYFAEEEQYMGKLLHDFGPVTLNVTGGYARNTVRSRADFNMAVQSPLTNNPGLTFLNALALNGAAVPALGTIPGTAIPVGAVLQGPLAAVRNVLIPNGPSGGVCQSSNDPNGAGVYGGNSVGCLAQSLDFDESSSSNRQYSVEAHIDSQFDGPFNFLIGGIYVRQTTQPLSYYVNSFGLDYASGILGALSTIGGRLGGAPNTPNFFRATPFYHTTAPFYRLNSYGVFGETYLEASDRLKLTLGLRYNNDRKRSQSRVTLLNDVAGNGVNVPIGSDSITDAVGYAGLDFDVTRPGAQTFFEQNVRFQRLTGRAVVDYRITRDNLLYASYSRGYKSGGINPPVNPALGVSATFRPESIDAFEIGSKNNFGNGALRLNMSGFYYRYKDLQISRLVGQNAINDNINADIYGAEIEAIMSPVHAFVVNANFSYTKTKVRGDQLLGNPRDPSAGRSDAVIIKDLASGSNCAVVPTGAGGATAVNAFVGAVNGALGLRGSAPIPGMNTTGAFGLCSALAGTAASPGAALRAAFATPTGALPFSVLGAGVPVNIRGNSLPQTPTYKASMGAHYTIGLGRGGWTLVPRGDLNYTGDFYASIYNLPIDRIRGYEIVNAQVQLNAPDERFYMRAFVQNLTANNAITGQAVSDQATGVFTNIFTVEPRRYGVAAGFRF